MELKPSKKGDCQILASEPMTIDDKTGIEVMIPIKENDIFTVQQEAVNFFKYWNICPTILGGDLERINKLREELSIKPMFNGNNWEIRAGSGYGYGHMYGIVVMGNIPYPIDWDVIFNKEVKYPDISSFLRRNKTILRVDIGDLDFSASRESLEYTAKTCDVIVKFINDISDNLFNIISNKINAAKNYWEAKILYNEIFHPININDSMQDIYRLETAFKDKLKWKDYSINNGMFEFGNWDRFRGHIPNSNDIAEIVTTYEKKNDKIKETRRNYYTRITPDKLTILLVINNEELPIKTYIKYLTRHTNIANKVYTFRFGSDTVKEDFINKLILKDAPFIYTSKIHDAVKVWVKENRKPRTTTIKYNNTSSTVNTTIINNINYVDLNDYRVK